MSVARMPSTVSAIERAPFERGDHVEVAERMLRVFRTEASTVYTDGQFYQYARPAGVFAAIPEARLSQIVQSFAGAKVKGAKGKSKDLLLRANDVGGAIRLAQAQAAESEFFAKARPGIAFSDCFVEVAAERIITHEHSDKHRARYAYPFGYVAEADPVRLLSFFGETFRDDIDAAEKIRLFQEYLGVSMLGLATKFQRAIVMVGDGSNGKGVASKIAEACMPPGSVCAIPPQDCGQEYRRALLAGKSLNVVSELPEADIMDSESWKAIVAGDTVTGRHIREAPFSFRPIAGHIYSANRLPGTTDQSHGFWRRILVMGYSRIFAEHEQKPNLAEEIIATETPRIVAWGLRGAQRVLAQGTYTVPQSAKDLLDKWRTSADQVRAFVDAWTARLDADAEFRTWAPVEDVYRSYRYWAEENGHKRLASNSFGERMRLVGLASKSDGRVRRYPVAMQRGGG